MPRRKDEENEQPGIPAREARLLDVNHRDNSVILILDDGSSLELAEESVPPGLPETGEMLSVELLAELRLAAERKQVARMIFAMLDRRLQPLARIRDKAAEKGYSVAAVDAVLEQMASRGLYSDRRYAEAYCRDCLATKAVGRRYLIDKLRGKRVSPTVAVAVAGEVLDDRTEAELAVRAAAVRWKRIKDPGEMKSLAKVVRFLQSRGFNAGTANRAARKTKPEISSE
ncbi:MAG: regulatory protein RecX [Candidatus Krumholzibacteriota bacterium]